VNGTSANVGPISLRNVHLRAAQSTDYVQPARDVELFFVAVNSSPDVDDKLVSITSEVGKVTLTGDTSIPANGVLTVGEPDGQIAPLESAERADAAEAVVALSKPITNGLTYNFTFDFEKAGQTTVTVTTWPKRVRSTAARNATTSLPNGLAAARIAAPGEPSTKSLYLPRSMARPRGAPSRRPRPQSRSARSIPATHVISLPGSVSWTVFSAEVWSPAR
jgi:hypothetical protein